MGGAGGDGIGDAGAVACWGATQTFPKFDRRCATDSDCVLVNHQSDCCGSTLAMAVNRDAVGAFNAAEATCERQYPGCACAPIGVFVEDGTRVYASEENTLVAACDNGSCRSKYGGKTFTCGAALCTDLDSCQVFPGVDGGEQSFCSPLGTCHFCDCLVTPGCQCTKGPIGFTVTCGAAVH
jgi:hypothetical protein